MHLLYEFTYVFFFNDTATTEIYTLSLHDALPISCPPTPRRYSPATCTTSSPHSGTRSRAAPCCRTTTRSSAARSEEHTSELQSRQYLVCRLLLEKKKKQPTQKSLSSSQSISIRTS